MEEIIAFIAIIYTTFNTQLTLKRFNKIKSLSLKDINNNVFQG